MLMTCIQICTVVRFEHPETKLKPSLQCLENNFLVHFKDFELKLGIQKTRNNIQSW